MDRAARRMQLGAGGGTCCGLGEDLSGAGERSRSRWAGRWFTRTHVGSRTRTSARTHTCTLTAIHTRGSTQPISDQSLFCTPDASPGRLRVLNARTEWKWPPAHGHTRARTHPEAARLQAKPLSPEMCRNRSERCENPRGLHVWGRGGQGTWLPPPAPRGWVETSPSLSPTKGQSTQDSDRGRHTFRSQGWLGASEK